MSIDIASAYSYSGPIHETVAPLLSSIPQQMISGTSFQNTALHQSFNE